MTMLDLDIIPARRPSDFDPDVMVGGAWVASAKNHHAADDTACEVWYRTVLEQPPIGQCVICDCAAWQTGPNGGPLCPDHFSILQEAIAFDDPPIPTAVTLTSIIIDQALLRNRICKNPDCEGPHYTWQCPAIHARLRAEPVAQKAA